MNKNVPEIPDLQIDIEIDPVMASDFEVTPHRFTQSSGVEFADAYVEFFAISFNENTNAAYAQGIDCFFDYCAKSRIKNIAAIEPKHVGNFSKYMNRKKYSISTIRLYLTAIRMFFNFCQLEGIMIINPSGPVKMPKQTRTTGSTPVIEPVEVRQILNAISEEREIDYRDRALIATMAYNFFRISSAVKMKVKNYELRGQQRWLTTYEKGSKYHEMPVPEELEILINAYLFKCDLFDKPEEPLFQSAKAKTGKLTGKQFDRVSAWKMIQRKAKAGKVFKQIGNHTFRATGLTNYLNSGGDIKGARNLANHSHSSTTELYDRTGDANKIEEINRISY